jgi:hypothetical protein
MVGTGMKALKVKNKQHSMCRFQGMWMLHYDAENAETGWAKLMDIYMSKEIDGLIRISCSKNPYNNSKVLCCYVGPDDDEAHCRLVGRKIIQAMKYERQNCNFTQFVYYKLPGDNKCMYKEMF